MKAYEHCSQRHIDTFFAVDEQTLWGFGNSLNSEFSRHTACVAQLFILLVYSRSDLRCMGYATAAVLVV
jgi:hypothetical protein